MKKATEKDQLQNIPSEKIINDKIYTERFLLLMRLVKTSHMIKNATIISAPEIKG